VNWHLNTPEEFKDLCEIMILCLPHINSYHREAVEIFINKTGDIPRDEQVCDAVWHIICGLTTKIGKLDVNDTQKLKLLLEVTEALSESSKTESATTFEYARK